MSTPQPFVLSEEAAQQLRSQLWDAESILRLLVDHTEMLINSPGELHSLDGFPAVLKAAADKVEKVSTSLESFHLPRIQGGKVLPSRADEAATFQRKGATHA